MGGLYGVLYREWSGTVHVDDLHHHLLPSKGEGMSVRVLRATTELPSAAVFGLSFFMQATRRLIGHYLPRELQDWQRWYRTRLREPYMRLTAILGRRNEQRARSTGVE
jgi:hypothetical protein